MLLESDDLVPGDIVSLKSGKKLENVIKAPKLHPAIVNMQKQAAARQGKIYLPPKDRVTHEDAQVPCDMILLCGRVIVDESITEGWLSVAAKTVEHDSKPKGASSEVKRKFISATAHVLQG